MVIRKEKTNDAESFKAGSGDSASPNSKRISAPDGGNSTILQYANFKERDDELQDQPDKIYKREKEEGKEEEERGLERHEANGNLFGGSLVEKPNYGMSTCESKNTLNEKSLNETIHPLKNLSGNDGKFSVSGTVEEEIHRIGTDRSTSSDTTYPRLSYDDFEYHRSFDKKFYKDRSLISSSNLTFKKYNKHCGTLKEKPPLYASSDDQMEGHEMPRSPETDISRIVSYLDLELEAILGLLKMKRIYRDRTYKNKGYKYKTEFQVKVLNDILHITPYPSSQVLDALGTLLNLKPRSVQIWFQNARQGGDLCASRDKMREMRRTAILTVKDVFSIFRKNIEN